MKAILIGSDGLISRNLQYEFKKRGILFLKTSHNLKKSENFLDLHKPDFTIFDDLIDDSYDFAIMAAGISRVDVCEKESEYAFSCNVDGTLALAKYFANRNITSVVFSSDYVFDGIRGNYTEDSKVNPLNNYGRHKAIIEEKIPIITNGNYLILRLSKVYTSNFEDNSLIAEMYNKLICNQNILAAKDQIFCPIHIDNVIESIINLLQKKARGLFNLCATKINRYELALNIAKKFNKDLSLIKKISLDDLKEDFKRPKNTSMSNEKIKKFLKVNFINIEELEINN